ALALMSKPMVMTLPIVLLLLDWWPLGRWIGRDDDGSPEGLHDEGNARRESNVRREPAVAQAFRPASAARLIGEKLPLLAMAVPVAIATMIVQRRVGAVAGLEALPPGTRITNATVSYAVYIWKTIWPSGLAAFYPFHAYPLWVVLTAGTCLTAATIGAFLVRARWPHVFVGWFWYVITLAPVIGLTQAGEQARADRFMYVPMIGLLVMLAWTVDGWLAGQRGPQARAARNAAATRGRSTVAVIAVAAILACAVTARAQVETWSDSVTLWQHALALNPDNYVAYGKLGEAYRDRGKFDAALLNYQKELTIAPANSPHLLALLHNDIGIVLTRAGRTVDASPEFASAIRFNPRFAEAHSNFANTLAAAGQFQAAEAQYRIAIALQSDFTEAHVGLGGVLLNQRRASDALSEYTAALALDPNLAQAHNGLGASLAMLGRSDEAMTEYHRALQLNPELPTAHLNIAVVLITRGRIDEARRELETALAIDPGYAPARQLLDNLR
ncbi:MAG: tetratricopeptide repeat protein, partial [Vicinamibacterales bacterium]